MVVSVDDYKTNFWVIHNIISQLGIDIYILDSNDNNQVIIE